MQEGFHAARLQIKFGVERPVELIQLTLALQGFARDYRRYANDVIREKGGRVSDDDIRLYVTDIHRGSILAELASAVPVLGAFMPLIDVSPLFTGYVQFLGETISYLRALASKPDVKPSDVNTTKAAAQAVSDIVAVVANQPGSSLHFAAKATDTGGASLTYELHYNSEEAAEAQRGALIAQKVLDYRGGADYENVLLYFQRTSTDLAKADGRTDDKAVVNSISPKALPVHFASALDAAMVNDMKADPKQNPFKAAFRVDVNVETDRNRVPRFYRVVHIHEVIPDEENDAD